MLARRTIQSITMLRPPSIGIRAARRPILWLAWGVALLVGTWAGGVRPAAAACTAADLAVSVTPVLVPSDVIPVAWHVSPGCPIIETGLLLGRTPDALTPAGSPLYGPGPTFQQTLPASDSGPWWVAAYARDESGAVVQSAPQQTIVTRPPVLPEAPHGSHGVPPVIAGDAYFLQPAGEPTWASLRRLVTTSRRFTTADPAHFNWFTEGFHYRRSASTRPAEIVADQPPPLVVGPGSFPVSAAAVQGALAAGEASFADLGFPHAGLYDVTCGVYAQYQPESKVDGPTCGSGVAWQYYTDQWLVWSQVGTADAGQEDRASITYFIPRPPAGKQMESARLRVFTFVLEPGAPIQLNGKAPSRVEWTFCRADFYCMGWVTWEFTEEARVLAAQGGSELTLTLDPIPPKASGYNRGVATWNFVVKVNYPWRHGHEEGGLTLTFADACPQELKLSVMPSAVRPDLPSVPENLAAIPRKAVVEAIVKRCQAVGSEAPAPEEVIVTFAVFAPKGGSQDDGGHEHDSAGRETGTLRDSQGTMVNSCMVREFNEHGIGTCQVIYHAGPIAGTEFIGAVASGYQEVGVPVIVGVPESFNLPTDESRYVAVGNRGSHAGTNDPCRPIRPASLHSANHFGQPKLIGAIRDVAAKMLKETGIKLRVNDMSLP